MTIEHRHNDIGAGEGGEAAFDGDALVLVWMTRIRELQLKLFTLMACADPGSCECAEFERGLAIEFATSKEYRE